MLDYDDDADELTPFEQDGLCYGISMSDDGYVGMELFLLRRAEGDRRKKIVIPDIIDDRPVIEVMANAFFHDPWLEEIVFGKNIRSVHRFAFAHCPRLKKITLNEELETIEGAAFLGDPLLKSVTIPEKVDTIGAGAFTHCASLTTVTIKAKAPCIKDCAFSHLPRLKSVHLGKVEELGEAVFAHCHGLLTVKAPFLKVEDRTFAFDDNLESVIIGTIDMNARNPFLACRSLKDVTIKEGLRQVRRDYFLGCQKLMNITGLDKIDADYLRAWSKSEEDDSFGYTVLNGRLKVIYPLRPMKDIRIPARMKGRPVLEIADDCFFGQDQAETVFVPPTVEIIGECAFRLANSIKKIELSKGLLSLGDWAFAGLSEMTSLKLPSTLKKIGYAAFADCHQLRRISIPTGVKRLEPLILADCENLRTVHLRKGLEFIDMKAFHNCHELFALNIPQTVREVINSTNAPLESLTVDERNPHLDSRGNCNCVIKTEVKRILTGSPRSYIPKTAMTIARGAFLDVVGLERLFIPANIQEIDDEQFCKDERLILTFEYGSPITEWDLRDFNGQITYGEQDSDA